MTSRRKRKHGSAVAPAAVALSLAAAASSTAMGVTSGSFFLNWTDRVGVTHPLLSTQVSLYDSNNGVETLLGTWVTDGALGRLNFSTNYVRPGGGPLQVVADVKAVVTGVGSAATGIFSDPYSFRLAGPYSFNVNTFGTAYTPPAVTNTSDAGKMVGFLQGLKVAREHFVDLGLATPYVNVSFSPAWVGGSYMNGAAMTLGYNAWGAWDEAFHEFAHGVADLSDLDIEPQIGSSHAFNRDNISDPKGPELGADAGTQFAWQEGIATYLGTSALRNRLPVAIPTAPAADYNTAYDRFASTGSTAPDSSLLFSVNLEARTGLIPPNTVSATGQGEGDEVSVIRVLWDLEDGTPDEALARAGRKDQVGVGPHAVVELMRAAGGRLTGLWQAARASLGQTPLARSLLGDIFEANSVSAIPGAAEGVVDGATTFSLTPTLAWTEQNSGHSSKFMVAIYSADFSTLLRLSPQLSDVTSWQLTDPLDPGTYNWVVISNSILQGAVDFDDSYWSGAASFTIVPEPGALGILAGLPLLRRRVRR